MSILGNDLLLGSGDEGYNLTRSLRFRSSASASLGKTFASNGNRKTWTWSGWVKRGTLGAAQALFDTGVFTSSDSTFARFGFNSNDTFDFGAYSVGWRVTTQVFRDPSAWYHIVLAFDTTQATASNRVKLYVNGTQVTAFSTSNDPTLNTDYAINQSAYSHLIAYPGYSFGHFDGYLTEINFIDGQALTPSSFGSTNTLTGVWQPARYTGTYGTNGFYLPFTDNSALTTSSNVGLGKDFSGNGNYWVTNNISITSGTTYDSMTDVPTLTSATAANFAVLNPLFNSTPTLSSGNLNVSTNNASASVTPATIGVSSGKWYWEATATSANNNFGIISSTDKGSMTFVGQTSTSFSYYGPNGNKYTNAAAVSYGASYTTNDVIGVALDMDAGTLTFYKNGTTQGTAFTGLSGTYFPATGNDGVVNSAVFNFGQRPFTYTPPTGYVALNTYNLPTSTIVKGNTVMDATLWTGDGTSPRTITNAAGFKPDLVWFKSRSTTYYHQLADSVRGATKSIYSNVTNAEENNAINGYLSSINSNGFSVINGSSSGGSVNANGTTYVAWQWQAGQGTTSTNTSGTISATVSVNASAGFSVVTYTGNGSAGATLGHGLGVAPSLIFIKSLSATGYWIVYSSVNGATKYLTLNTTDAVLTNSGPFNNTAPTSSVFSVGNSADVNSNGTTYVAYCWTPIAGYSAFGSYTANGVDDGPFIYTGFRPKFIMVKNYVANNTNWTILDTSRDTYNGMRNVLLAESSAAETTGSTPPYCDVLSNGFKLRSGNAYMNYSTTGYIYMAFAESPFKHALAR